MTPKQITARINEAWVACSNLYRGRWAENFLDDAWEAAAAGERRHRRGMPPGRYRLNVSTCATYFVVKWFLEEQGPPTSWAQAASIRDDARLALAARDRCPANDVQRLREEFADVLAIDYSKDIACA